MTNDSLVSIVNTTVYGRSKKYKLEDTSEITLVQWAVETKQLLLAHPELAKAKRLLDGSITPEAKNALWSCVKRLEEVAKEYPLGPMTVPAPASSIPSGVVAKDHRCMCTILYPACAERDAQGEVGWKQHQARSDLDDS